MIGARPKIQLCEITGDEFVLTPEQIEAYEFFDLPLPKVAPEERFRHQLAFRNDHQFFWRRCSATNRKILSVFPPDAPFPVYDNDFWRSDQWDPLSFGREFDFQELFVDQLLALWWAVPRPATSVRDGDSSQAVHAAHGVRDSFFVFNARQSAKCMYSSFIWDSRQCIDCYAVLGCRLCSECIQCVNCSRVRWGSHCTGCKDSWFLSNCVNCSHCLFCANLEGKSYHVFNRPVTKEVFEQTIRDWCFTARPKAQLARERFAQFLADKPVPQCVTDNPRNTSGNYLYQCIGAQNCYECFNCSNLSDCNNLVDAEHCVDGFGGGDDLLNAAQFVSVGEGAQNIINCVECWSNVNNLTYCSFCEDSSDLFACVGLRGKSHCIFNKQYSKDEYEHMRNSIVSFLKERQIWGKFFPAQFSAHPYNYSSANIYMPLGKVPAKMMGFRWDDTDSFIRPSQLLDRRKMSPDEHFAELPERLDEVDPSTLKESIYLCELTGKPFTISSEELSLCQRLGVAPPVRAFEQRNLERIQTLAPRKLLVRLDEKGDEFVSAFPEEWDREVVPYVEWRAMLDKGRTRKVKR